MRQLLEAKGWVMYYECNCKSGKKQYFSNTEKKGYEVMTRATKNTFVIIHKNMIIAGPFWGYQLEEKLFKYIP